MLTALPDPTVNATEGSGTGAPVGYCLVENQPRCYFMLGSAYCPAPSTSGEWSGLHWEGLESLANSPNAYIHTYVHTHATASGIKWTNEYMSWVERTSQVLTNAAR